MGLRKEAQNGQKGEALKAAVDRKDNDAGNVHLWPVVVAFSPFS
jgi:hypothetical protein